MEYTVLLKPNESSGYSATIPALPGCETIAASEDEAVKKISLTIKNFLHKTKFVRVKVDENGVESKTRGTMLSAYSMMTKLSTSFKPR